MTVLALVIDITFVCCLAAYLLHRYGNWRKQHVLVTLATFIAWYFSFMIIFVLPIDVSNTLYRQCIRDNIHPTLIPTEIITNHSTPVNESLREERAADFISHYGSPTTTAPMNLTRVSESRSTETDVQPSGSESHDVCKKPWSYVPPDILPTLWHVVYWTSQALTWLVLPMMQSYSGAGDFTVLGKIKTALIANAVYYGSYLLIFIVCLIYVAVKPGLHFSGEQLKVLAITASNTWGLFLLVLLLGYGLVEVPRACWNATKRGHQLALAHFKLAKLSVEKSEAEENLEDVMDDVKKAAETIKYNHPFRKFVETIVEKCPATVQDLVKQNRDDYVDYNNPTETPTEKSLVRLHKKVIKVTQTYQRTQVQWAALTEKAINLEDVAKNETNPRRCFQRSYGTYDGLFKTCYSSTLEWYWECWLFPWGLRVATVFMVILTAMVVWSECLFFVKSPVLSLFAVFINLARTSYDYFAIEFICFVTIAYLSVCAYSTIFKLRVFNYIYLASHHMTNEYSLIFAGMMLCRLTPPLCLNFLGLIHLDSHVTKQENVEETYYTQIMGHMDVISFISDGFNIYFPILILLLCVATYFHLGSRCLHLMGFEQFIGDDDFTQELVDEGKELLKREHRKRQRLEESDARRRNWQERFGDRESTNTSEADLEGQNQRKRPGGQKIAKSPTENDRTELLKEAEPMGYTKPFTDPFKEESYSTSYDESPRYQSQAQRPPSQSGYGGGRFGTSSSRTAPPKGIFDDI